MGKTFKTIHYMMTARHLTGDSEVQFFASSDDLVDAFNNTAMPIVEKALAWQESDPDNDEIATPPSSPTEYGHMGATSARVDSGSCDEIDLLLNECNHYWMIQTLEHVPVTHTHALFAFCEWVDESEMLMTGSEDAIDTEFHKVIEEQAKVYGIDLKDPETWEKDNNTLFDTDNETYAYFFHHQNSVTYKVVKM